MSRMRRLALFLVWVPAETHRCTGPFCPVAAGTSTSLGPCHRARVAISLEHEIDGWHPGARSLPRGEWGHINSVNDVIHPNDAVAAIPVMDIAYTCALAEIVDVKDLEAVTYVEDLTRH